jgi:hypothetical protein
VIVQCINEACRCGGEHVVILLRYVPFHIAYHGAAIVVPAEENAA